jgi:hypothetical protein
VLATDAQAPEVAETAVGAHLLHPLEVVAQLGVDLVGEHLRVLAIDNVALPVEEPCGDLVLCRVLDDGDDALELFRREFTGAGGLVRGVKIGIGIPLVQVHVGLLADQIGVPATDTLDLGQGVHDLLLAWGPLDVLRIDDSTHHRRWC